jgi:endonuclease G
MTRALPARLLPLALALAALAACTPVHHAVRPPMMRARQLQSAASETEQGYAKANCGPFGIPKLDRTQNFGPTTIVYRQGYVLEHSATDRIALWVCEGLDRSRWDPPNANRKDVFAPDPKLPANQRAELSDYKGSGFDRGHMAPAGDFADQELKNQSFYLSNMAPQSPPLNQQAWRLLEDRVRGWADSDSPIHIYTGGFFYDPNEEEPSTADGQVEYQRIGANKVAVPTHFYKIVVGQDEGGAWRAVAFVFENRKYEKTEKLEDTVRSVEWIQERTGIDFMPELDEELERKLEREPGAIWK